MKANFLKFLALIIIFAAIFFYISHNFTYLQNTFHTTLSSLTGLMLVAFGVVVAGHYYSIRSFIKTFHMTGIRYKFWHMLKLQLSALAVNVIIPVGGFAGTMVFADDAKKRDVPRSLGVAGSFLFIICDYTAVSLLLFLALFLLLFTRGVSVYILIPALIFVGIVLGSYFLVFAAAKRESIARKLVLVVIKPISALIKKATKKKLDISRALEKTLNQLSIVGGAIKKEPNHLKEAIGLVLVAHLLRLGSLYLIFVSLGYEISLSVLFVSYVIGMVFVVVSPTPSGIGFVEGVMYLIYSSFGVPGKVATTAVIIFRAFQFWLPFLVGLFFLQQARIKEIRAELTAEGESDE